jgi:periplasmic divalent cation tolerance protein
MTLVSVYVVFADADEAQRIGRMVIEEHLAACINILGPCRSIYRWNDEIEDATEIPAVLKTTASRAETLIARIARLHSYDVPCITVSRVDSAPEAYANWVEDSTAQR